MDRENKKIKNAINIGGFSFLLIVSIIICYFKISPNFLFIVNMCLLILICFKAKFSIISLQTILLNYILLPIFSQYNSGESYGILELGIIPLNYEYMNFAVLIYNIINVFFIYNTDFLVKEKKLLEYKPKIRQSAKYIFSTLAIIVTLIALPSVPFQIFDIRVVSLKALLPGNAWNHIAIVCLIFVFSEFKKSKYVKFSYAFVLIWFLSHFERVDILGLIVMVLLLLIINVDITKRKRYIMKIFRISIVVFFLLTALASVRVNENLTIEKLLKSIFVHSTASDISYTYNSAIQYNIDYGDLNGKTYKNYFIEAIPLLNSEYKIENILQKKYYTAGGAYLLCEPIMNFGIIGVVFFKIIELIILYKLVDSKYEISYYWYLFIIATIFRSIWYGISYIELGVIYFIPMCYFFKKLSSNSKNIRGDG